MEKKKGTFQSKLYSMFIVSVIIPLGTAVFGFMVYTSYVNQNREKKDMDNVLRSVSQNIENHFRELKEIGNTFYMQKRVFQLAERLNKPELYQSYDPLVLKQIENDYCMTMAKLLYAPGQDVRGIAIFPVSSQEQKGYYLGKESAALKSVSCEDCLEQEWFQQAVEEPDRIFFLPPHERTYVKSENQKPVYSLIRAIRNMDNKRVIGVIKVDAGIQGIQESVNAIGGDDQRGLVVNRRDQVIARSPGLKGDIYLDMEKRNISIDGREYLSRVLTIPGSDWELGYVYSYWYSLHGYLLAFATYLVVILTGTGLAFFIYRCRSEEIISNIGNITETLRLVEQGDLDHRVEVCSDNELGVIAEVINQMMQNLKRYIEQEYLLVIQNQKAEYHALQSQINPHFLYNTLNGFVALNRMGEKKKLEQSIIGLSHLFQYTCRKRDTVSLREEFNFLEEYLKLEKLKFEERLDYMFWMDEKSGDLQIPKLLLQPVVENCIEHGMGETDTPILITVSGICMEVKGIGQVTVISVRDNGVGFHKIVQIDEREHTGVANVKARAELYCPEVVYQFVSVPGKGTKTTFVFPGERCGDGQ